ncbi:two-component system response regulator [Maritalea porphyrae]|jgi:two-component system chemotaxis response regulator CheY|uniref:response regulator n=1 Tax=Maritalea porphyrae TaxID=880732 RepID=UPI0022AE5F8C|nr:response regulator [Maritalea porphyrae]MCZ4273240.1 response regulator [Maritalea porphyrae]
MPSPSHRYNFSDLDIIVVDDSEFALEIMRIIFAAMNIKKVRYCSSSVDCLAAIIKNLPDIVVVDLLMKPKNGYELIRRIRAHASEDIRHLPILVATAYSSAPAIRLARDVGASEILCKPLSVEGVYDRFVHMRNHPRQFVKIAEYVGPDRRRTLRGFEGMDRRAGDTAGELDANSEQKHAKEVR